LDGLPKRLVKRTPRTITSRTTLAEALDAVAAQGFAVDLEENETGAHCVAAAIPLRGLAAALSVSGPAQRLPVDLLPRIGAALVQAVATIAARFEAAPGR
jgi:IclR family acetate operon transcriptional repressor